MEKIKPILAGLYRHHFWILSILGIVAILYCWNASVSEIEQQFGANKALVKQEFAKLQGLSSRPRFPNQQWAQKTKERSNEVIGNVKSAWKLVLEMQRPVYAWPKALGEEFAAEAGKSPWDQEMVQFYAANAPKEIENLRTMMGAAKNPDAKGVVWNQKNYDKLLSAYEPKKINSEKGCRIRQTSLWVYQALANAIAFTNTGDEFDPYNLPIHQIEQLGVERMATLDAKEWTVRGFSENAVPTPPPAAEGKNPSAPPTPAEKPVPVQAFLDNINAAEKASVPGYDRLAFLLRVRMDLAHLDTLLTACANSPLPLDIHGLRFHRNSHLREIAAAPQDQERQRFRPRSARNAAVPKPKNVVKPETITFERGTMVELWGYAYFAKDEEVKPPTAAPPAGQAAAIQSRTGASEDATRRDTARSSGQHDPTKRGSLIS